MPNTRADNPSLGTSVLIYAPALVFSLLNLTTDLVFGEPVKEYWGWTYSMPANPLLMGIIYIWVVVMGTLCVYACLRYYLKVVKAREKLRAKYILIGISIPAAMGFTRGALFLIPQVTIPELATIGFLFASIFTGYGIWKLKLFALTPETAAENIISTMSDALFLLSPEGKILKVNQATLRLLRYEENELINQPVGIVFAKESEEATFKELGLAKTPSTGSIGDFETTFKTKTDEKVPIALSVSIMLDKDGTPQGLVCIGRDLTERERTEQEIREKNEELERRDKERKEFLAVITHELKTPLTSLIVSSGLLVEELEQEADEPHRRLMQNIESSAHSLNNRLSDLLNLARMEAGGFKLELEPVDIAPVLQEMEQQFTPIAMSKGQLLTADIPASPLTVVADRERLRQIISNLLLNAIKFTPPDGSITLRARKQESSVVIEVEDNGPGISKEEQERLFQPYYRIESDRQRFPGLGLGLALSKQLVEAHGGEMYIQSEIGRGSIFGFSLPLYFPGSQL